MISYVSINQAILELLNHDPQRLVNQLWKAVLPLDRNCRSRMLCDSDQSCEHCENVGTWLMGHIEIPFVLQHGPWAGQPLYLTKTPGEIKPFLKFLPTSDSSSDKYQNTLIGDSFTIKFLITLILQDLFHNLPHMVNFHLAFICHEGYMLYSLPSCDDQLCNLEWVRRQQTKNYIYGMLLQLFVIFDVCDRIDLSLPVSDMSLFLYDKNPCSYEYRGVTVCCPITLILSKLSGAELTFNNLKLTTKTRSDPFCSKMRQDGNKFLYDGCNNTTVVNFYLVLMDFMAVFDTDEDCKKLIHRVLPAGRMTGQWLDRDPWSLLFS
jgi:hypothetical protein